MLQLTGLSLILIMSQPMTMPMPAPFPIADQSVLFPNPQMAYAAQPSVFAPTPSHIAMTPAPPTAIITTREAPVVPSPPPMSPTLSDSSVDSDITPTIATVPIPPVQHLAAPPSVLQESMVPLPPSPMFLSPQPLGLPTFPSAQHMTRDLPVMSEAVPTIPKESDIVVQPPPAVHASEYTHTPRDIPEEEISELPAALTADTPPTPVATASEATIEEPSIVVVIEDAPAPEEGVSCEDQHASMPLTEEPTSKEVVMESDAEEGDTQDRSIIASPKMPKETATEVDDSTSLPN
jgi:hypothetical protein